MYNYHMTMALQDILAGRFDEEPPEIKIIKDFVLQKFNQTVAVSLRDQQIIIATRSSALAGALRPHLFQLRQTCQTTKRLVIRIG